MQGDLKRQGFQNKYITLEVGALAHYLAVDVV